MSVYFPRVFNISHVIEKVGFGEVCVGSSKFLNVCLVPAK